MVQRGYATGWSFPPHCFPKSPSIAGDAHFQPKGSGSAFAQNSVHSPRDGYAVRPLRATFDRQSLAACGVLVISNALPNSKPWETYPSPTPSAFARDEVASTLDWVRAGGNWLLIADHMPCAGAAANLAAALGVTLLDSFALEGFGNEMERQAAFAKPTLFRTADETLRGHAIVHGRGPREAVTSIRSFMGQAASVCTSKNGA